MKSTIIFLSFMIILGCYGRKPEITAHKGEPIPNFNLFLADSSTYLNTGNLPPGKSVILFYFGPRCPYSRTQMQNILDEMNQFKKVQFVVFTTSPFYEMKWFYSKYKLYEYPNIITGVDYTNFFMNYFKTNGVPYLAIYGNDHRLIEAFSGLTPVWQIKDISDN